MEQMRRFQPRDAVRCSQIINANMQFMPGVEAGQLAILAGRNTPEVLTESLANRHTVVFEREGEVLGLGALKGNEISKVFVNPTLHRQGIGRRIVLALLDVAQEQGIEEVVFHASPIAADPLRRNGATEIGPSMNHGGLQLIEFRYRTDTPRE